MADEVEGKTEKKRGVVDSHRPIHAGGLRRGAELGHKTIEHATDESVVYLVGKQVAIYSLEGLSHRFLPTNPKTIEIVTFVVSYNKRYIALSERVLDDKTGETQAHVSVYNISTASRIRNLSLAFLNRRAPLTTIDFSRDNKYLVGISSGSEPFIYLWQVDKAKMLGFSELQIQVSKVSISPWAHWAMCTTGPNSLRIWRYQDKQLKSMDPLPRKTEYQLTSHAWFDDDRLIAGTLEGDIIVIDNCEVKRVLRNVFGSPTAPPASGDAPPPIPVNAVYSIGRGFACGGEEGWFALYERTYDADCFQCYKRFVTPHASTIVDVTVSPNEESLICAHDDNELSHFSLANVDIIDHEKPEEVQQAFRLLPVGFHNDTVTGIDVCVQRSVIVTASEGGHVRIWNFVKKRMELRKHFKDAATDGVYSVSINPSGDRLLVGFKYKLCMYTILRDSLHFCQEFSMKQCKQVRFSNGGQYFAAVVVNRIYIFNAYSFEPMGHLPDHSSVVKSFCWSRNDQLIISAGFEGAIYEWNVQTCKRNDNAEYSAKAVSFSCVQYDDASQLVVAIGSQNVAEGPYSEGDITLRALKLGAGSTTRQEPPISTATIGTTTSKHSHHRFTTSEMAISAHAGALFVGTNLGELLVYTWPLATGGQVQPDLTLELHRGEILFCQLTVDERYLSTVGDDGCMFLYEVDTLLDGKVPPPRRAFNFSLFDGITTVLHTDIEEKQREVNNLQTQLSEEQRSRRMEVEQTVTQYSKMLEKTVKEAEVQIADVLQQRNDTSRRMLETSDTMKREAADLEEQRMRDVQELETLHSKRIKEQMGRNEVLTEEKNDLIVRYENKIHRLQKERQDEKAKMQQEHAATVAHLEKQIGGLAKDKQRGEEEAKAVLVDTEQENEEELAAKEKKMRLELDAKEAERLRAISDACMYRRKQDKHEQEMQKQARELEEMVEKLRKKDIAIGEAERLNTTLKTEIQVRNESVSASERKILELKRQNAELEKLRYVLTFKFNELRKEVLPKEESIREMNDKIEQMDHELERIGIDRDTLQQTLSQKDDKISVIIKEMGSKDRHLDDKARILQLLLKELARVIENTEPKKVVYRVKEIIEAYSQFGKGKEKLDQSKMVEFERQRFYMEAQLSAAKKQNMRREEHMRQDSQRKTTENTLLVREINDLRHHNKLLYQKMVFADSQLKDTKQQMQRMHSIRAPSPTRALVPLTEAGALIQKVSGALETTDGTGLPSPGGPLPLTAPSKRSVMSPLAQVRNRLARGTTRHLRDLTQMDPMKVADIIDQLEKAHGKLAHQDDEIHRLRDFVQHLLRRIQGGSTSPLELTHASGAMMIEDGPMHAPEQIDAADPMSPEGANDR
eukprot:TRINITY_DN695_c0_g2_i1.p1 TRINITY_DN695_c0_g2~~TRINITY_DN695_c0_g2_i1.p1  ORF type:complete len:1359 (+),score=645.67 TRINITY_DN695_c0_g2_i1:82-4158(+)